MSDDRDQLSADPPGLGDADPVAERRLCSVVFVDLVGFTALAEGRDAEEIRELLSRYFEMASTIVGRYGGVIEKFIGDAVMAVWGSPVATEEDAERAVRAALDLVDAIAELGHDADAVGLAGRGGVLTGEVAVTIGATNEGMVAGDAVNTAARIQSVAAPGSVLVDTATRRLTDDAISYVDAGAQPLRGKAEPEQLWRADRVVSSLGGAQRVDGLEAPLTGRGAEVRSLRELFHASVERRHPRLVLVSGPAGVGKSRLGWEFEKYIDGLADEVWWHRGRCLSYGDGLVYWALAEAVRQRFSIAEEDPPTVAADKLREGLDALVPDDSERAFIMPRLARLLGVKDDRSDSESAPLTRDDLFAGWRRLFEQLAAEQPVAILIEDAHHAAPELLDFLDHLVDWARDLPIFVLVFARPDIDDRRPGFGSGRNRASITVDPLDDSSMDRLVDELIPETAQESRQVIIEQAQGIPLYAVETIRSLIDRGIVRPIDGRYALVGDIGELGVPDSLHALLAARLDALDPQMRRVVADAAVLGGSFPVEAVTAVSGLDAETTESILGELLRREVLEISADPLSPERGSYRFAQEILRQVAYETLSRRDRKSRHLAVAEHLRTTFPNDGEEVIDAIARHYVDALELAPEDHDRDELARRAVDLLVRAGDRAKLTGSPGRSVTAFSGAAELLATLPEPGPVEAAELWLRACHGALMLDKPDEMTALAERARAVYAARGDGRNVARCDVQLGRAMFSHGRLGEARVILSAALDDLRTNPDEDTLQALQSLASTAVFSGSGDADATSAEALALAHTLGVSDGLYGDLLGTRAMYHDYVGERRLATMYLREAARLASADGDGLAAARAFGNLANTLNVDRPTEAIDAARQSYDILVQLGGRGLIANAIVNLVFAQLAVGDWDAADESVRLPELHSVEDHRDLIMARALVAGLHGDADDARALIGRVDADTVGDDPQLIAARATVSAFAAMASDDRPEALRHALASIDAMVEGLPFGCDDGRWAWPLAARVAHELERFDVEERLVAMCEEQPVATLAPMQRAEAVLIRARLAAVGHGASSDADTLFAEAIAQLREHSTPYHLGHGLVDHAEHLRDRSSTVPSDDREEALIHEALAEARSIAAALRCRPLAERVELLTSSSIPA